MGDIFSSHRIYLGVVVAWVLVAQVGCEALALALEKASCPWLWVMAKKPDTQDKEGGVLAWVVPVGVCERVRFCCWLTY